MINTYKQYIYAHKVIISKDILPILHEDFSHITGHSPVMIIKYVTLLSN